MIRTGHPTGADPRTRIGTTEHGARTVAGDAASDRPAGGALVCGTARETALPFFPFLTSVCLLLCGNRCNGSCPGNVMHVCLLMCPWLHARRRAARDMYIT